MKIFDLTMAVNQNTPVFPGNQKTSEGELHTDTAVLKLDPELASSAKSIICKEDVIVVYNGSSLFVSDGAVWRLLLSRSPGVESVTYANFSLDEGDELKDAVKEGSMIYVISKKGRLFFAKYGAVHAGQVSLFAYGIYDVTSIRKSNDFDVEISGMDIFDGPVRLGLNYGWDGKLDITQIKVAAIPKVK